MCSLLTGDYPEPTEDMINRIYTPVGNLTVVQHTGCPARQIRDCTVQIAANQFLMFMQHTLREFPEP